MLCSHLILSLGVRYQFYNFATCWNIFQHLNFLSKDLWRFEKTFETTKYCQNSSRRTPFQVSNGQKQRRQVSKHLFEEIVKILQEEPTFQVSNGQKQRRLFGKLANTVFGQILSVGLQVTKNRQTGNLKYANKWRWHIWITLRPCPHVWAIFS